MNQSPGYQAQCFGNIEPTEYMVPYPNLRSLPVGQCIKFSENILYKDLGITNGRFLKEINQYSNWLSQKDIKKGDRILVLPLPSPYMEILSFAIWSLGAVLVIANDNEVDSAIEKVKPKLIIEELTSIDKLDIDSQSDQYTTISGSLLRDEAVFYYNNCNGIILNQYNLLINTYGVLKHLNILSKDVLNVDIPFNTTAATVLKTILPLYAGTSLSNKNADITFSLNNDANYQIKHEWTKLIDTNPQSLYILPEATAILAIGSTPNHLMSIIEEEERYKINGHSVMEGYQEEKENSKVFASGSLIIHK